MEEGRSSFKILTDKPTKKIHLGRPCRRREDSSRIDLKEIDVNSRNWIDSAQDRDYQRALVNETLNRRVPYAMELVINTEWHGVGGILSWKVLFEYGENLQHQEYLL